MSDSQTMKNHMQPREGGREGRNDWCLIAWLGPRQHSLIRGRSRSEQRLCFPGLVLHHPSELAHPNDDWPAQSACCWPHLSELLAGAAAPRWHCLPPGSYPYFAHKASLGEYGPIISASTFMSQVFCSQNRGIAGDNMASPLFFLSSRNEFHEKLLQQALLSWCNISDFNQLSVTKLQVFFYLPRVTTLNIVYTTYTIPEIVATALLW